MLSSRFKNLVELDPRVVTFADAPEELAFQAHARDLTLRNIKAATLFIVVASALAGLVDLAVYRGSAGVLPALAGLRATHALVAATAHVALRTTRLARRVVPVTVVAVAVCSGALGGVMGRLGDLGTPWFHFTYAAAIGLLVPVVTLRVRALLGLTFSASLVAGLAAARPLLPPHPMLLPALTFLLFTTGAGTLAGHAVYRLVEQGFHAARAKSKASHDLADLNRSLDARVRKQTRELRMLAAHIEGAREAERARVARELHDELGQELTALRYTLTFLRRRFERDPASIRVNLDELESLLGRTAATTRQLVSELRPRALDDLGLVAALEWLLRRTEERTGLVCKLSVREPRLDVGDPVATAAFRILQEALTNVAKHARATRVEVEVALTDGALDLGVRDDGVGMPAGPPSRPAGLGRGGMGLIGMRERAGALGGELRIETGASGTVLRVRLPWQGVADDEEGDA